MPRKRPPLRQWFDAQVSTVYLFAARRLPVSTKNCPVLRNTPKRGRTPITLLMMDKFDSIAATAMVRANRINAAGARVR